MTAETIQMGDRVRVLPSGYQVPIPAPCVGSEGVVTDVWSDGPFRVGVLMDQPWNLGPGPSSDRVARHLSCRPEELELLSRQPVPVSRQENPRP